jgi:hypothetical protein
VTTANVDVGKDLTVTGNVTVDTDTLFVDSVNDRVGIGTNDPFSRLTIMSDDNDAATSLNPSAQLVLATTGADLDDDGDVGPSLVFTQRWYESLYPNQYMTTGSIHGYKNAGQGNYGGGLIFKTQPASASTPTERLRIDAGGNVGIGTTNPSQTFEVNGETALISADGSDTHNTIDRTLYIGGKNSSGSLIQAKCAIVATPSTSHGGAGQYGRNALHFCVGPDAQNDTNASKTDSRMCIDYTGNVGIGTTTPNAKLQVDYTEGTLSNMNYSATSSWHDKGLGIKGGQGGFLYGHDINHSIFLRQSPFGATDHNAYCNNGYHAFYTGGMIESQTEKMRIQQNGNVDILSGDLDVVGSYKSHGNTVQRTLIKYEKFTSSTGVSYASGTTGYQDAWSVTYTRVHSGSEIYIIGDLCLAQAMGATGTTSYRGIFGRLRVNSGGTDYYSDSTYDWQRIDNSFHEYQRQSRVHFNQQALSGTAAGQTMTIYAQVEEGNKSGTTNSFGLNVWAGRSFIEVFEVM